MPKTAEKKIEFSDKFEPLFRLLDPNFHPEVDTVIMTGGRYSSKSFVTAIFSIIALVDYGWNILYTRYTSLSIVDSIKPEVSDKVDLLGKGQYINDTSTHIESGKNRIAFKGIKTGSKQQTANLKALSGFNMFVVDEAEELPDLDTFKKVFYSIRSNKLRNLNILILNPTTRNHWIYKEFFEDRQVPTGFNGIKENVLYTHTSYKDMDAEHVPNNILADYEKLKEKNPKKYDNIVEGGWITEPEGVLLPYGQLNFIDTSTITPQQIEYAFAIGDPANTGGDNYSMIFCWVIQIEGKIQVVVRDVIYSKDGIEALTDTILMKLKAEGIEECYLEVNGVGLASYLSVKPKIENHTKLKPLTTTENKEVKILSNYEFIKEYFCFAKEKAKDKQYAKFMEHLSEYSKEDDKANKHKMDAIDNASMASKIIKVKYKKLLFG
jgi:PBSX family phage terminase large subunit